MFFLHDCLVHRLEAQLQSQCNTLLLLRVRPKVEEGSDFVVPNDRLASCAHDTHSRVCCPHRYLRSCQFGFTMYVYAYTYASLQANCKSVLLSIYKSGGVCGL